MMQFADIQFFPAECPFKQTVKLKKRKSSAEKRYYCCNDWNYRVSPKKDPFLTKHGNKMIKYRESFGS